MLSPLVSPLVFANRLKIKKLKVFSSWGLERVFCFIFSEGWEDCFLHNALEPPSPILVCIIYLPVRARAQFLIVYELVVGKLPNFACD